MFIDYLQKDPRYYLAVVLVVIVSICLHELAHGVVAIAFGDGTPIERGHITLNPMVHMGGISLIFLLLSGISWGAMPVDERRMRGKFAPALVAAAGPATNLLLALLSLVILGLWMRSDRNSFTDPSQMAENARFLLYIAGVYNVLLLIFNLIPVPPLDGGRILRSIVPAYRRLWDKMLQVGGGTSPFLIVAVLAAGWFVSPLASKITDWFLDSIVGR
jgi:Zn-dependent protease